MRIKCSVVAMFPVTLLLLGVVIGQCHCSRWIYQHQGVFIEHGGMVVQVDQEFPLIVGVHIPHPEFHFGQASSCGDSLREYTRSLVAEMKADILAQLPKSNLGPFERSCFLADMCDSAPTSQSQEGNNTVSRQKRFLGALGFLGSLIGLGTSFQNSYDIHTMKIAIQEISENTETLKSWVEEKTKNMYDMVTNTTLILAHRVDQLSLELAVLTEHQCHLDEKISRVEVWGKINYIKDKFIREILTVLNGEITPVMFPLALLSNLEKGPFDWTKTIYNKDPLALYQLAIPTYLRHDVTTDMVYFLLRIPIVSETNFSPIWKIHNFGWWTTQGHRSLVLPNQFYTIKVNRDTIFVPLEETSCTTRRSITICKHYNPPTSQDFSCLAALLGNMSLSTCVVATIPGPETPVLVQLPGGVLVRGYPTMEHVLTVSNIVHIVKKPLTTSVLSYVPLPSQGHVKIGDNYIAGLPYIIEPSKPLVIDVSFENYTHFKDHDITQMIQSQLSHASEMKPMPWIKISNLNSHLWLWGIIITMLSVAAGGLLYHLGRKWLVRRSKEQAPTPVVFRQELPNRTYRMMARDI